MTAVALDRWQAAQAAERGYWYPERVTDRVARRAEERARLRWIAGLLDIGGTTVAGRSVLDIAGGPAPLVAWGSLPLAGRVLVDPLALSPADADALEAAGVERYAVPAEGFALLRSVDEVWGYNALQHVQDPAAVLATAMHHAVKAIRWFEWIDQPMTDVHPHTVGAALLTQHLDAWGERTAWTVGFRDESRGWCQTFAAGVWER